MYEPIRGGTRGGAAEFKWSDVSADKDREHYLGHSINAPTGRWQKNKDIHWYNRDSKPTDAERIAEIKKVKEAEADALAAVLGFTPTNPSEKNEGQSSAGVGDMDPAEAEARKQEKEEKRQKKLEKRARKEEKRRKKAEKRERSRDRRSRRSLSVEQERWRRERRSRSRSPPRRRHDTDEAHRPITYHERRYPPPPRSRHYSNSRSRSPVSRHRGAGEKHEFEPRHDDQPRSFGEPW